MKKDARLWIGGGTGEKAFDHAAVLILKYINAHIHCCSHSLMLINPFIPVSAKTATSQVDLQVWKG